MSPIEKQIEETVSRTVAEVIGPIVKQAVAEAFATSSRADPEQRLRAHEAAPLLGMSEAALRKRAQRGDIACERVGRSLRFVRGEIVKLRAASASR